MKTKRGISPLLASVLLVALAITLAAIVSNFVIQKAKEFKPGDIAEGSLYCESVTLGYSVLDPDAFNVYGEGSLDPVTQQPIQGFTLLSPLTIINRGAFSIQYFIINAPGVQSLTYPIYKGGKISTLPPGQDNKYTMSIQINTGNQDKEIKIIPVIKNPEKEGQFIKCIDRQIVLDYGKLCLDLGKGC